MINFLKFCWLHNILPSNCHVQSRVPRPKRFGFSLSIYLSWLIRLSNNSKNVLMKYYDRLVCPLCLSKVSFYPLIPWFSTKGSYPHNWSTKASQRFLYAHLQLILFLRNAQYDHQISWRRCTTLMGLTFC